MSVGFETPGLIRRYCCALWPRIVAVLIAGALTPLAFAPFQFWPLAIITPAVLMLTCHGVSIRRAFMLGWLFGFSFYLCGVYWVYISIHEFGHAVAWAAAMATVGFAVVLALFPAFTAMLAKRLEPDSPLGYCLIWPASWVLFEWVRSWILTGFPWLSLGYSQTDTWLSGLAPVSGVYGLSFLLAASAGLLVSGLIYRRRAAIAAIIIVAAHLTAIGLQQLKWTRPAGEPLHVALLQGNFGQDIKWDDAWLQPQLNWYAEQTLQNLEADLILWPETALPAFFQQLRVPYWSTLSQAAQKTDTALLAGMLFAAEGDSYNAVITGGAAQGHYKKIHLVPLGEYFPMQPLIQFLMPGLDIPMNDLAAGSLQQPLIRAAGYPVAVTICYEDAYSHLTRRALPAARYLVNVSNDAWFGDSLAPHQHLQIARMLALQAGRPLLRAANTGISAVIDFNGEIKAALPQFEQGVLHSVITPRAGTTPWSRWGYWPVVVLCCAIVISAAFFRFRRHA